MPFLPLLDDVPACAPDQALSCRIAWQVTGDEAWSTAAEWLIGKPLAILVLLLLGFVIRWIAHRLIDRAVKRAEDGTVGGRVSRMTLGKVSRPGPAVDPGTATTRRVQRARTMGSLVKSVVSVLIFAIVLIMAISEIGYDVAPLLASAGIVGIALGFGAQSLVQDFLSGIFMILEDQYGVGDEVDLGEAIGTIEAVGLRVTRLRDINGTVWYVRNGEILRVGNMSQHWARTVLDIAVGYREDVARVRTVLEDVAHDLWEDEEFSSKVIEEPSVWGVQELTPDGVLVRVVLKTRPLDQWSVAREMRERIKSRFDAEGIEIPRPQRVVWHHDAGSPEGSGETGAAAAD